MMNSRFCPSFLWISFVSLASLFATSSDSEEGEKSVLNWGEKPVVVSLGNDDLQDGRRVRDLERLVRDAEKDGVSLLMLDLDVSVQIEVETQLRILDLISETETPTVAFVNSSATSSGALLALAADKIYLTRGGIIG